jgi:competence protein ComEC
MKLYIFVPNAVLSILLILSEYKGVIIALLFFYTLFIFTFFRRKEMVFTSIFISVLIFITAYNHYYRFHSQRITNDVAFSGNITIDSKNERYGKKIYFVGILESGLKVNIRISNCDECQNFKIGDSFYCEGTIKPIYGTYNFAGFNIEDYYMKKHIIGTLEVSKDIARYNNDSSLVSKISNARIEILNKFEKHKDHLSIGFILALVIGSRDFIENQHENLFQKFGLVHLIAISGMQVHIFTFAIYIILIRIGFTKERTLVILILLQPVICILTGLTPSVTRATFTTAFFLICKRIKYKLNNIDILTITFYILINVEPYLLFDIGFQLSYIISASLILSRNFLINKNYITTTIKATCISQLSSFTTIIYHFNEISLLSIPLNFLFIPIVNLLIFPMSIFYFVFILITSRFHDIILYPLDYVLNFLLQTLDIIDKYLSTSIILSSQNLLIYIIHATVVLFILYSFEIRSKKITYISLAVFICILIFHSTLPRLNNKYLITMIDVGQGDCILIQSKRNKEAILVDTGGNFLQKNQEFMVNSLIIPTLKANGVSSIDALIITHGDFDHTGNTLELIKNYKIKNIILGEKTRLTELEIDLIKFSKLQKVNLHFVRKGSSIKINDGQINFLTPYNESLEGNAASISFVLKFNKFKMFFSGDLEEEGEKWLLREKLINEVNFLKVSHHGSKGATSIDFLKELRPSYALISTGRNNLYSHPNNETLDRLVKNNTNIYRTDLNGAIKLIISKKTVTLFTARP